ncbi:MULTISPECIES: pyroglutamyl-peptidase I [Peribacillus]|jgi:pyroglutamyl-peptidase|uniref:pyroglutamyl-peptidase I n=1 Tax=Peribacillus TaxID=2675229 RepID=UPI0006F750B7|nr:MULTISPECIES: pyroglutamyl-peptidase I [unclassified Peribacillus]KQU21871.1 pyrrolidone-carboxylate peptidase [Bacillus sp. Leaf13]KRF60653.1 pyrrolidone-carboxylate peptidase [Bacillus sp. Soil768D1]MBK5445000.1 pyroglutamyl-peptidase I [Peribacillus sp. TH24]MBK5460282.1 pyroglutamyl-peptidase I [Peribacillus sp. TH27]MBK5482078.1 pyroglutamyl-peptidase I [Peribacillus sp. TH16]
MKQKVLLTGFEPFGGERVNPSWEAVKQLHGEVIDDVTLVAEQIPTVFGKSVAVMEQLIQQHNPDIVICVGQAGGRLHITPERVAINMDDARIPDNQGNQPIDEPIADKGPVAYWSTIPIKRIVENMKESNIPASVSHTAGTFVCNHIFYGLMDYITRTSSSIRGGFIHIPFIPEQTINKEAPSLSLETIVKGIKIAAVTAAKYESDIHTVGGTTH